MTIRFAPAKSGPKVAEAGPLSSRRARALRRRCVERISNDNCPGAEVLKEYRETLDAALRHFADHGLDAPIAAQAKADCAKAAGDQHAHQHWTDIAAAFQGGPARAPEGLRKLDEA